MKKVCILVGIMMVFALFAGCASTAPSGKPEAEVSAVSQVVEQEVEEDGDQLVFGCTVLSMSTQFTQNMVSAMEEAAAKNNIKLLVSDANYEIDLQISQVEDFITSGVDAVILNPCDADGLVTAANACEEAGIPLILVNSVINSDNYTAYVGSSDDEAGKLAGEFAIEQAAGEPTNVLIMHGLMGHSAMILREKGFKEAIDGSSLSILDEQTANWQRDEGMTLMEDWLMRYDDIDIVFAENDEMALGAIEAIKNDGRTGIKVIGVDAIEEAVQAVKDGSMAATIFQDAAGQGSTSVETALKIVNGETVNKEIIIPFITISADNVNEYFG